jgi:hypothetical protein
MKRIYLLLAVVIPLGLQAQHNIGTTYCEHNDLNASRYQPSELDFGNKQFQIGFNYDFWLGNKNIDYFELSKAFTAETLTQDDIRSILSESGDVNNIGVGQNYQVIGIGYQYRAKSGRKYDLAITIVDKFSANLDLSKEFLDLALEGNSNDVFLGKTVNLGKTKINALYTREYAFNIAMPIFFSDDDHKVRIGIRPKFIQGLASVKSESSKINMTTQAQGEFIQIDYDYNYQTSGVGNFDPFKANGKGYGLDLGVTGFLSKHFEVVASVLGIGAVTFDQNTKSYQKSGVHKFEGQVIPNLLGTDALTLDLQDDLSVYNPDIIEGESYTVGLPTKIGIELEYKTPEKPRKNRLSKMSRNIQSSKKKIEKAKETEGNISNTIYFTYIQGVNDNPGNTTRPFVSIGYMHDFHDYFDIGISAAYGGFNNLALGSFFAFNIGHTVKFGFSSDNLTALILPKTATGFDIATNFSLSF